jgi:hypothetical protein
MQTRNILQLAATFAALSAFAISTVSANAESPTDAYALAHNLPTSTSWMKGANPDSKKPGISGWAVVSSDYKLNRGKNAVAARGSDGSSVVNFNSDIRKCNFIGTVGLPGASGFPPAGYLTVVGNNASNTGVFVQTFNASGTLTAFSYYLLVTC